MIAQLISARALSHHTSSDSTEYRRLVDLVERLKVGGFIFFQGNAMGQHILIRDLQRRSRVPLLVSQDMEFGPGMRLPHTTTLPSMMAIGATGNPDLAYEAGSTTAREARALGVQQVHAPVGDINTNSANPVINTRAFGDDPALVSSMVQAYIKGVQDERQLATVKHFPGHGDTSVDSHLAMPVVKLSADVFREQLLVPFRSAIEAGVRSVMVGHLAVPALDDSMAPATLSAPIVTGLLREELGFDGLIVTDAMDMQGLTDGYGVGEASVRAIEAGVDMLLMPADEFEAHSALLTAVQSGRISEARIRHSVRRILSEKIWSDLPHAVPGTSADLREAVGNKTSRKLAERIAEASVTKVKGSTDSNLSESGRIGCIALYDHSVTPLHDTFVDSLAIDRGDVLHAFRIDQEFVSSCLKLSRAVDALVVASFAKVRSHAGRIGLRPQQLELIKRVTDASDNRLTLVSFGSPYVDRVVQDQFATFVCAYSDCQASQTAAARALKGDIPFSGTLPVTL